MTKNIIFFGPPGSGKGTQINKLKDKLDLEVISSGDISRRLASEDEKIRKIIDSGELLNDKILFEAINKKIRIVAEDVGIVFDGFPRTIAQAKELDKVLLKYHRVINAALYIYLDESEVVKRLTARRVCSKCGQPLFDLEKCPICGGVPIVRKDDNEVTIMNRMKVFLEWTLPLVNYYKEKNILIEINGKQSIDGVAKSIIKVLEI